MYNVHVLIHYINVYVVHVHVLIHVYVVHRGGNKTINLLGQHV